MTQNFPHYCSQFEKPDSRVTVIIADDHELFRDGLKAMIKKYKGIEVIAEAVNGTELVEKAQQYAADVVVTDIQMPGMDGIQACRMIKSSVPSTNVIALSFFDEDSIIVDMLEAGATGYLLKSASKQEIITGIKSAAKGDAYYCSTVSSKLFRILSTTNISKKKVQFSFYESSVIKLICKQLTTKEMADQLHLCVRTVEDYRHKIQEKTGAKNAVGIALFALKNKLISLKET